MCDHKSFVKCSGGLFNVCDNGFCFLTDDELKFLS